MGCFAVMHGPVSPGVSGFDNIFFFFVVAVSQEKAGFFIFTLFSPRLLKVSWVQRQKGLCNIDVVELICFNWQNGHYLSALVSEEGIFRKQTGTFTKHPLFRCLLGVAVLYSAPLLPAKAQNKLRDYNCQRTTTRTSWGEKKLVFCVFFIVLLISAENKRKPKREGR